MYEIGQYVVFGYEGVYRVESIGPLDMKGVRKDVDYYTLTALHQNSRLYAPVDAQDNSRPILTGDEARQLIADIPTLPEEQPEGKNPRLLAEYYQNCLRSNDCRQLVALIRGVYAKRAAVAAKGRRLGQVDERYCRQAEDRLCGELSVSLDLPVDEVRALVRAELNR